MLHAGNVVFVGGLFLVTCEFAELCLTLGYILSWSYACAYYVPYAFGTLFVRCSVFLLNVVELVLMNMNISERRPTLCVTTAESICWRTPIVAQGIESNFDN